MLVLTDYVRPERPKVSLVNRTLKPSKSDVTWRPWIYARQTVEGRPGQWYTDSYILLRDGVQPERCSIGWSDYKGDAPRPNLAPMLDKAETDPGCELFPVLRLDPWGDSDEVSRVILADGEGQHRMVMNAAMFAVFECGGYTFRMDTAGNPNGCLGVFDDAGICGLAMPMREDITKLLAQAYCLRPVSEVGPALAVAS